MVAAPATTPDVVGQDVSAATEALELLGAVVRERIEVRPELTAGTVLSTSPAAGEVLGEVVEVVVADPGNAFALTDFPVVDSSSCSITDDALLVGAVQPLSYSCRPDPEFPGVVELAVGRQASSLQMTLGADDRGGTQPAALVVIGDGREFQRLPVAFGGTQEVRLDVSGVLRLRLEVRTAAVDDAPSVVLGDAVLLGGEAGLGSLASS